MRCSKNATISEGPDKVGPAIDPFRTHLKNRILVQDRGGAEFSSIAGFSIDFIILRGIAPLRGISRLIHNLCGSSRVAGFPV